MKKAILQSVDQQYKLLNLTFPHNREYAINVNASYHVFTDRNKHYQHPAWGKIYSILELFDYGYDYILFLDGDAVVIDKERDIFDELIITPDNGENYIMHVCSDGVSDQPWNINTGVMLIKNNYVTQNFFKNISNPVSTKFFWERNWEQNVIHEEIKKDSEYFNRHIKIYDVNYFNHNSNWIFHPCFNAETVGDREKEIYIKAKLENHNLDLNTVDLS